MAKVKQTRVDLSAEVELVLTEKEVRALCAIFGYDVKHFLRVFYERMGEAYVKPHEAGVISLHNTIRQELAGPLEHLDKARQALQSVATPNRR